MIAAGLARHVRRSGGGRDRPGRLCPVVNVLRVGENSPGGELDPLSDSGRLRSALAQYRLTLGQPRQEDLVDMLVRRGADADELPTIDLRPPGPEARSRRDSTSSRASGILKS